MPLQRPEFTARQRAAWLEVLADLASRGVEARESLAWPWLVLWEDEVRPGRGHDFHGTWVNDDILADVRIDVYGGWDVATAELRWVHDSANDECDCERCARERDEEL